MNRFASHILMLVLGFLICLVAFRMFSPGGYGNAYLQSVAGPHPSMVVTATNSVAAAAEIAGKYVVSIDTVGRPMIASPDSFMGFPFAPREVTPKGKGSGVIISPNGYIVTNNHVVSGAANLTVTLYNGKHYTARLVGRDTKTDMAVIKIGVSGLNAAKFGDSDTLKVGDWVIAVGNALGLGPTVTSGIISATKRGPIVVENEVLEDAIQTDAAINRGNSGGALADLNGSLVGINTAIASSGPDGGNIGISFAVPSNTAKKVAAELIKHGKVVRPWLGISYAPYDPEVRAQLEKQGFQGLPKADGGALISEVMPGSPAANARLQPGDIILKINGKPLSGSTKAENGRTTVAAQIGDSKVGQKITLEVWHMQDRRVGTITAKVGEMPVDLMDRKPAQPRSQPRFPFPLFP